MPFRFVPPPNWPQPEANWTRPEPGWTPPPDWQPPAGWDPAPPGWQFWREVPSPTEAVVPHQRTGAPTNARRGQSFRPPEADGGDKVPFFGARSRAKRLTAELTQLKSEMARLGALEALELQQLRDSLRIEVAEQRLKLEHQVEEHQRKLNDRTQQALKEREARATELSTLITTLERRHRELSESIVKDEETSILQEAGIYRSRHPLTDAAGVADG